MPYLLAGSAVVLLIAVLLARAARLGRAEVSAPTPKEHPEKAKSAARALSKLIAFPTVTGACEGAEWAALRAFLAERYPMFHRVAQRETVGLHSLVYRWASPAPQGEPVLFCGHLDVVPAAGHWEHPPFAGTLKDGFVWGRGALDCKSVVICLLEAAEALIGAGFVPSKDIYFAFGHDEETGGEDGAARIARLFAMRDLKFSLVLDEGRGVQLDLLPLKAPAAYVGVAEKGVMNVTLTARGEPGHASEPHLPTPLSRLGQALARAERCPPSRLTPLVRQSLTETAPQMSFSWRLMIANRHLFGRILLWRLSRQSLSNPLVRTTLTATQIQGGQARNVLPALAEANLNVRLLHGDSAPKIMAYLHGLFVGLQIETEAEILSPPSVVSDTGEDSSFPLLRESIQAAFGTVPVVPSLLPCASDARHYELFSHSVYRFSPFLLIEDETRGIHGLNERVRIASLGTAVAFYEDLISRLAGGLPVHTLDN